MCLFQTMPDYNLLYMANSISPKTGELLRILDRQKPSRPTPETILQIPSSTFSVIRQIYNSFKKDNQSRISQNKVYQLKIPDMSSTNLASCDPIPVRIQSLFCNHQKQHIPQLLHNMLILKSYLPSSHQKQMIQYICKQIIKIDDLPLVMSLFKKLLKSKECLNDRSGLYHYVEGQMVTKMLGFTVSQFGKYQVQLIRNFLYSLPYIGLNVLNFIADLFLNIKQMQDFFGLISLFTGTYKKLQQQTPPPTLLTTLIKITIPEHLTILKQKQGQLLKNKQNSSIDQICEYKIIISQACKRINQSIVRINQGYYDSDQENFKEKQKNIVDFIFIGLELEAFGVEAFGVWQSRGGGYQLWGRFVDWHHFNYNRIAWKTYISVKMANLITNIFRHPKPTLNLITYLLSTQSSLSYMQQGHRAQEQTTTTTITSLEQSVIQNFIHAILSNNRRYLQNKIVRQFVAYGLIKDQSQVYQQIIFNTDTFQFVDVILSTLVFVESVEFFRKLVGNITKRASFQRYLVGLMENKPKKFKDFFVQVDSSHQGLIFQLQDHYLLRFFSKTNSSDIIISFLRDMASYLPSKFSIELINNFIKSFVGKPEHKLISHQAVRTLHIILSTRQASQLGIEFKKHLRQIIELKVIGNQVFKNVPQKMINDLSAFYQSAQAK